MIGKSRKKIRHNERVRRPTNIESKWNSQGLSEQRKAERDTRKESTAQSIADSDDRSQRTNLSTSSSS